MPRLQHDDDDDDVDADDGGHGATTPTEQGLSRLTVSVALLSCVRRGSQVSGRRPAAAGMLFQGGRDGERLYYAANEIRSSRPSSSSTSTAHM